MKYELVYELNETDRSQVIHVLASSFPLEYSVGLKYFGFFLDRYPDKCYLLARSEAGIVIGLFCLVNRGINYGDITLGVTGMSYMAVLPEYRNLGISTELMQVMIDYAASRSDMVFGFARKVMDNYWEPYGFIGFTNFGKLSIDLDQLARENKNLSIQNVTREDLPILASMHRSQYTEAISMMSRTSALWNYIGEKLDREERKLESIRTDGGEMVGYLLRSRNTIEELCLDHASYQNAQGLIYQIIHAEDPGTKEITLQTGLGHPFSKYMRCRYSHSISTRYAWNGGHVVRVNDLAKMIAKITPVLERRLRSPGVAEFHFHIHNVAFTYSNQCLQIKFPPMNASSENDQRRIWQRMIFGVQDARDLFGHYLIDEKTASVMQIMFPVQAPQVPILDQF